jgi:5S rRNA maturation endonuclease (ribonuclease M5)
MTPNQTNKSHSIDYGKLNALAQLVCYDIEALFEKLEVDLRRTGKMYIGCCSIHQGDNYSALNLYPEGERVPGIWRCNTRQCHTVFQPTIIGFARGVLSQKYFGWTPDRPKDGIAPFNKVITWLCKLVRKNWNDITVDEEVIERSRFANQIQAFKEITMQKTGVTRSMLRKHLEIPAEYYLKRGYSQEILDNFDVGLCQRPGKELYGRVVVPIYDESGEQAVAFTGRSIFEKCDKCGCYHNPTEGCPDKGNRKNYSKWKHSGDSGSTLYNWWGARQSIRAKSHAVLVEGPGDVWRLREAGVDNVVGMLGAQLTDEQQILLERSGAMKLTLIRDNDAAGEMSEKKLREELSRSYKIKVLIPSAKDVGEMSVEKVKQEIVSCL